MSTQTIRQYNEVTPIGNVVSVSPFHTITYQEVLINVNPDAKEVYKQEGGKYVDDVWIDVFALTDLGLSRLANAAGIHGMPERIDDRSSPHVCAYRFNGEWVQPDSTVLSFSTDYELDLRDYINVNGATVKGARFEQALQAGLDLLIAQHFKDDVKNLKGDAKKNKLALLRKDLDSETLKAFEERAEEKALKSIIQMRVHMISRAQTGAKERFIRKVLGLKNAYTIAELKNPFRIPRSEFRLDKMVEQLGPELSRPLLQLKAASLLNIAPEALAQYTQLASPQTIHPSHVATTLTEGTEQTTDGIVWSGEVSEESTTTIPRGETPQQSTPPVVEQKAPLAEAQPVVEMIDIGGGVMKPRDEKIGMKNANSERFKKVILCHKHFLDKDGNPVRPHFDRYIMKYFGLNSPANLTWEMFVAMRNNLDGKGDDIKYYKPEKKAEPTLAERIATAGLLPLVAQWRGAYSQEAGTETPEFIEQVENVLVGIANGFFATGTPAGLSEIDDAFRSAMRAEPL